MSAKFPALIPTSNQKGGDQRAESCSRLDAGRPVYPYLSLTLAALASDGRNELRGICLQITPWANRQREGPDLPTHR